MRDLAVVGLGLVSPVATTAREHVFFLRAECGMAAVRAFVDAAGEPLDVMHCQLVDPTWPARERLSRLGGLAIDDALATGERRPQTVAHLCGPTPWEGFGEADALHCERAWGEAFGVRFRRRFTGAASVFEALGGAAAELDAGASAVMVVALDSFASPPAIAARLQPANRWEPVPPRLSEAAAVIVVTREAHQHFGHIVHAAVAQGTSSDIDDEPVDGQALTRLLRNAAPVLKAPIGNAFGPTSVDNLRRRSWEHGVLRNRHAFSLAMKEECVEHAIGRVGAAAGGAHLVFALASQHYGTLSREGATVAWAVSREGQRGLSVVAP